MTENYKYLVSVKTLCKEDLVVFTNKKENLQKCELQAVKKLFRHQKICDGCSKILEYWEEEKKKNSKFRVESKARCGEVIYQEVRNSNYPNYIVPEKIKKEMERGVVYKAHLHQQKCIKCQRNLKLKILQNL